MHAQACSRVTGGEDPLLRAYPLPGSCLYALILVSFRLRAMFPRGGPPLSSLPCIANHKSTLHPKSGATSAGVAFVHPFPLRFPVPVKAFLCVPERVIFSNRVFVHSFPLFCLKLSYMRRSSRRFLSILQK